ncbi:hypothetical protein Tco_0888703 [Tanacetum coccineum]
MRKVLQERGFESLPSSTKTNLKDHVKSISTAKDNSTGIRRIISGPYAVSDSQISNVFSETVPFPRRLHDYCCDKWKEACELKILETYSIGTTLHDDTLPPKEKGPKKFYSTLYKHVIADFLPNLSINIMTKRFYNSIIKDEGDHEGKKLAGTLIDMPIFVGKFSIISGFSIIDDMDVTSGVVLGMPFCKKFASCQKIMEKFERRDECEQIEEE